MLFGAGFTWFHLIPAVGHDTLLAPLGIHHHTWMVVTAWMVCLGLIGFALVARAGLNKAWSRAGVERYFPEDRLTPRTAAELYLGGVYGLVRDIIGDRDAASFVPLIAGLFIYIFASNLLGVIPGFLPPTENINNNVGMAVIVFIVFNYVGLSRDFKGYIAHLWGPMFLLGFLLFPIELIGLIIRPVSLSLRLTGNIFGDHTVFSIMSGLIPVLLPVPFLMLAIFVSFIQAFVFSLLSTIYVGLSLPHHDHAEEHH